MSSSKTAKYSCLKKPSELWPGGLSHLLKYLSQNGFDAEFGIFSSGSFTVTDVKNFPKNTWTRLAHARSFDVTGDSKNSYSFIARDKKIKVGLIPSFDLLFLDSKSEQVLPDGIFCVRVTCVADAFNLVLKALWLKEFTFKSAKKIGEKTKIGKGTVIEPGVLIGPFCEIGKNVVIETGCRIGAHVKIGNGTRVGAHSRLADHSVIGEHCHFHSHVAIGSAGFGILASPDGNPEERVHIGKVIVGDFVRLGAFVAIDRGVFDDTYVSSHCAVDNLVQIAHNCVVGEGSILCSFVGLSGSTRLGKKVTIAGMVGTKGHVSIGDGVTIAAQSGISRDIEPGQTVKGYPPRPLSEALKIQALVDRLPELYSRLKELEAKK